MFLSMICIRCVGLLGLKLTRSESHFRREERPEGPIQAPWFEKIEPGKSQDSRPLKYTVFF